MRTTWPIRQLLPKDYHTIVGMHLRHIAVCRVPNQVMIIININLGGCQ